MNIRTAERRDLSAMLDIYNYEVKNGTATFDVEPRAGAAGEACSPRTTPATIRCSWRRRTVRSSATPRSRPTATSTPICKPLSFPFTSRPESRGRGIASALMEAVLRLAREDADTHTVVSVIAGGNAASVRLHEKFGFTYSGTLHEVGLKFGRYLDIVNYELRVG